MMRFGWGVGALVLAVCCLGAWAGRALGQEADEVPSLPGSVAAETICECECAKLNTEDAVPVGPGEFELGFAYAFSRARRQWDDHWDGEKRGLTQEHAFEAGLTHGIADNLDIGVSWGYADIYDRDDPAGYGRGVTDLGVGAKWRFYHNEDTELSLAYLPGVTIPIGRRSDSDDIGPSQEYWSFDQKLAMTKFWGRWTMNADVGYSLPLGEDADGARGMLDGNVAVGYQVCTWLQPEIELNYAHEFVSGGDDADELAVTAGLIMPLGDTWRMDIGIQQSVAGRNSDRGTTGIVAMTHCW